MIKDAQGFDEYGHKYTICKTKDGVHVSITSDRRGFISQILCLPHAEDLTEECLKRRIDPNHQVSSVSYPFAELMGLRNIKNLHTHINGNGHDNEQNGPRSRW